MPIIKPSRHFEGSDIGVAALSGSDLKAAAEEILGPIDWTDANEGFCSCPGKYLHNAADAKTDCKVYLSPVPTVSCFHGSCRVVVEATTEELRRLARIADGTASKKKRKLTAEEKERIARVRAKEALRRQTAASRQRLLRAFFLHSSSCVASLCR